MTLMCSVTFVFTRVMCNMAEQQPPHIFLSNLFPLKGLTA